MGLSYAMLTLKNPRRDDVPPVEVEALADTGSVYLVIPEIVAERLQLETSDRFEVVVADGRTREVPYVGPIEIRFKNRVGYSGALIRGDQVLMGAIQMEDMDLIVIPKERRVDVNPASPDRARARG